jgi:hypothetical protein
MTNFTVKAEDLDFSGALKVISSAQKFVIPVPAFPAGGEPLVYPEGEKKGLPIADWQGKPIGEAGVVFFNGKDKSWQAASGNGSAVIIMNQVTEAQAEKLDRYVRTQFAHRPNLGFSVNELKQVLDYARNDLGIVDMYNSDQKFIASKMSRVGNDTGVAAYGLHKRDDRDICEAVYVGGKGEFQGPAATPQQFENGAVIVRQGDSVRLIQPEIFAETYRQANGAKLEVSDVPSVISRSATSGVTTGVEAPKKNNG